MHVICICTKRTWIYIPREYEPRTVVCLLPRKWNYKNHFNFVRLFNIFRTTYFISGYKDGLMGWAYATGLPPYMLLSCASKWGCCFFVFLFLNAMHFPGNIIACSRNHSHGRGIKGKYCWFFMQIND